MTVGIGVKISLDGTDNTGSAFKSSGDHAEKLSQQVLKIKSSWQSTVTAVSTAVMAFETIAAPLIRYLSEPVKEALATDKALSRLAKTIKVTGQGGEEASKSLNAYVDQMELALAVSDAMIASVINQNIAYGMNIEQAKKAMEAANALSKVSGQDLASANETLLLSINGQTRGLAKYVPLVNELTEDQLRHGEAISLVAERLGYLNNLKVSDPSSAIAKSVVMWDNFKKAIGQAIIYGIDWEKVFARIKTAMDKMNEALEKNRKSIGSSSTTIVDSLVTAFERLADSMEAVMSAVDIVSTFFKKLYDIAVILASVVSQLALGFASLYAVMTGNNAMLGGIQNMMSGINDSFKKAILDLVGLKNGFEDIRKITQKPIVIDVSVKKDESAKQALEMSEGMKAFKSEQAIANESSKRNAEQWKGIWTGIKSFFTGSKTAQIVPEAPSAKMETVKKETATAFSTKSLSTEKDAQDKRRQVLDAIDAMEKASMSERELKRLTSLNAIQKLEDEAGRLGVRKSSDFALARQKVEQDYMNSLVEIERAITEMTGNETERRHASQVKAMQDLSKLQNEAGIKSAEDMSRQAEQRRLLLERFNDEELNAKNKMLDDVSAMTGASYEKSQRDLVENQKKLQKIYEQGAFGQPGSEEALGKLESGKQMVQAKTAAEPSAKTAQIMQAVNIEVSDKNVAAFEKFSNDGTAMVGAIQGGATSIINAVGSMWGPIGQFIAAIVNFLRMSPEEMKKFIQELIDAFFTMMKNIVTNIKYIIEEILIAIPDILAEFIGVLLSAKTWSSIAESFAEGIKNALKGVVYWFKRMMFGSKEKSPYEKSLADQTKKNEELLAAAQKATFGSKDADAGEGRFKIKDVTESTQAGSLALVQQTLVETADEAGMSFGEQMMEYARQFVAFITKGLQELWKWVEDLVGKLWTEIQKVGKAISDLWEIIKDVMQRAWAFILQIVKVISDLWEGLKDLFAEAWKLLGSIGEMLKNIWDGLIDVIAKTGEAIAKIGSAIWEGLKTALDMALETFKSLGKNIWDGLKSGTEGALDTFKNLGKDIWNGLSSNISMEKFTTAGSKIWSGLTSAVDSIPTFFQTLGTKIWNGLSSGVGSIPTYFNSLGTKIWNGLSASISMAKFTEAGQTLYNGFFDFLNKGWINFTSAGGNIWVAFKNGIVGAWSWISSIGARIWDGLKAAAGGGAGGTELGGTLGTVANAIKSGLGFSQGGNVTSSMGNQSLAMMFSAMGALRAAEGIDRVPGVGISDMVPILARAGERVLTPQQARAMDNGAGSITLNITLNAPAGSSVQKTDIKQMGEQIIDYIRRESKNGRNILRPSGVY